MPARSLLTSRATNWRRTQVFARKGPTRIKFCGITSPADARAACSAGADAIGLVFYAPSPRAVEPARAALIAAAVDPLVSVVGLFVDADAAQVTATLATVPLDLLQFHGSESASFCEQFQRPYIKVCRVRSLEDLERTQSAHPRARCILVDTHESGRMGGTGTSFDWSLLAAAQTSGLILAGGLHKDNVAVAISMLGPAAVDVSSGVESAPGRKDHGAMVEFARAVRAARPPEGEGRG
jgi:phosphoribosylanthranilate isomerase